MHAVDVFAASLYHAKNLALHAASMLLYFFIISVHADFWCKFPFDKWKNSKITCIEIGVSHFPHVPQTDKTDKQADKQTN